MCACYTSKLEDVTDALTFVQLSFREIPDELCIEGTNITCGVLSNAILIMY